MRQHSQKIASKQSNAKLYFTKKSTLKLEKVEYNILKLFKLLIN